MAVVDIPRTAAHCAPYERMFGRAQTLPGPTVATPLNVKVTTVHALIVPVTIH